MSNQAETKPVENFTTTETRHVFLETVSQQFYFEDETQTRLHGPFKSHDDAVSALRAYAESLG